MRNCIYHRIQNVIDFAVLNSNFYIASNFISFGPKIELFYPFEYIVVSIIISVVTMTLFNIYEILYPERKNFSEIVISVFISVCMVNFTMIFIGLLADDYYISPVFAGIKFSLDLIVISAIKFALKKVEPIIIKAPSVVVFGKSQVVNNLLRVSKIKNQIIFEDYYFVDSEETDYADKIKLADSVLLSQGLDKNFKKKILQLGFRWGKRIYIIPETSDIVFLGSKLMELHEIPTLCLKRMGLTFEQRVIKRIFDIVFSLVCIIIALPFFILIYIAIKIHDGGPPIFRQERVTFEGKKYNLYKFRTMVVDAERNTGPCLVKEKDPRITCIGAFLRKFRIDEIPQFFNVFKGDMSFVGPRPERPFFVEQLKNEMDDYELRLSVKAGITGLAQVMGNYSMFPGDKLKYDLYYIQNYQLLMDFKIILQTIKIMFLKKGSDGISSKEVSEYVK